MSQNDDKSSDLEEISEKFADYHEGTLPPVEREKLEALIAERKDVKEAYDEYLETVRALSGLHKMAAPQDFEKQIEDTINRRSQGRFFGRRAFGDRVPFELLAIVVLILGAVISFLMWSSNTGSLDLERHEDPEIHDDAPDVVPRP